MKTEIPMFFGANRSAFEKAKTLRINMTPHEKRLWERLSNNQINGFRFRRQHPIEIYIADFYCHKAKLIVEVDGEVHNKPENAEYDCDRNKRLLELGINTLRFSNGEVENQIDKVIQTITDYLNSTQSASLKF